MERTEKKVETRVAILGLLFLVAIAAYMFSVKSKVVELIETQSENETVKIYIKIPKLQNTSDPDFENQFNNIIATKVRDTVEEVKSLANQAKKDGVLSGRYEVHITTEVKTEKRNFISIVMYYYTFTGGAHGNTIVETYNIDLVKSKFLSLKDIFYADCEYQKIIKEEITKSITSQSYKFFPEAIEYVKNQDISEQPFAITNETLEIYYQDYEIAPHSTGLPVFEIPNWRLKRCLRFIVK